MACLERERERARERFNSGLKLTHRQRYHKVTYWAPCWSRKIALYLVFESQFSIHVIRLRLQKRCEQYLSNIIYRVKAWTRSGECAPSLLCPESAIFSINGTQRNAFYGIMIHFLDKFNKIKNLPR